MIIKHIIIIYIFKLISLIIENISFIEFII